MAHNLPFPALIIGLPGTASEQPWRAFQLWHISYNHQHVTIINMLEPPWRAFQLWHIIYNNQHVTIINVLEPPWRAFRLCRSACLPHFWYACQRRMSTAHATSCRRRRPYIVMAYIVMAYRSRRRRRPYIVMAYIVMAYRSRRRRRPYIVMTYIVMAYRSRRRRRPRASIHRRLTLLVTMDPGDKSVIVAC